MQDLRDLKTGFKVVNVAVFVINIMQYVLESNNIQLMRKTKLVSHETKNKYGCSCRGCVQFSMSMT